jgi:hypothetical protein
MSRKKVLYNLPQNTVWQGVKLFGEFIDVACQDINKTGNNDLYYKVTPIL